MAIKTITYNQFNSIGEKIRDLPNGQFYYLENLNIGDFENSTKQVVNTVATDNDQCIIKLLKYSNTIYGIGFDNTTNKDVTLYSYVGSPTYAFVALTNGTVTGSLRLYSPFLAIMDGYIYFDGGNNYISRYAIATNTMTATWKAFNGGASGGTLWNGDLYGWSDYDNNIYKIAGASPDWVSMIKIPNDQTIKEIIPYGDYLAIICTASSVSDDGVSKMYLWDGVTTTTFIDIVDIGFGECMGGDILDGIIYAGINYPSKKGFRLKVYSGGIFQTIYTYFGKKNEVSGYIFDFIASSIKAYTGYIYFMMVGARPGSSYESVYEAVMMRYGKKGIGENNKMAAYKSLEVLPAAGNTLSNLGNDFVISEDSLNPTATENSLYAVVYEAPYKTRQVVSTSITSSGVYTAQAGVLETGIITGGSSHINKKLIGFTTMCSPLTTGQSVVVKIKVNADTSWTTVATLNAVGTISKETVNIEATGLSLPDFKELKMRIELLGGAELTGITIKYEEKNNLI